MGRGVTENNKGGLDGLLVESTTVKGSFDASHE
jgi:hypothetical protein